MSKAYRLVADRTESGAGFLSVESESAGPDTRLVICQHGLRSDKESMLETCYRFARRGFRAVAPDLAFHGENDGAVMRDQWLESAYVRTMFGMIEKSVAGISSIIDHFGAERAGIHGLSLGGVVLFAALLVEPRLASASVVNGSPDWVGMLEAVGVPADHPEMDRVRKHSPLTNAAVLVPRPMLMLHGEVDETVRIDGVVRLNETLKPLYAGFPERLDLVVYEGVGHTYLGDMIDRSIDWHERYL